MTLEIANKLIELRKARGVSQEELAAHLGISRQAISKWERGEASPDIDNIVMLSRFYGVSIDELLCRGAEYETAVEESAPYEEPSGEFPYEEEPAEPAAELKAMPVPEEGARFASVREIECSARASVTMFGAEGDEVSVELNGSERERRECRVYMDGEVLRIETPRRERFGFFRMRNTLAISIGVPRSMGRAQVELFGGDAILSNVTAKDLFIKTGGGDVSAVGTRSKGLVLMTGGGDISVDTAEADSAQIRTGGGEIEVRALGAKGMAEMRTGGGDMKVSCMAASVTAYSGGGDIELAAEAGEIDAKSGGGDLDIRGIGANAVSAKTGGGDIALALRGVSGAAFTVSTAGGIAKLSVNGDTVFKGRHIETVVGDGAAKVELRSGGGDISASIE